MDTEDMADIMVATMAEVMATHMVDTAMHTGTDTDVIMDTVVMVMVDSTDTTVKCHAIETVPAKTTLPSSL